MEMGPGLAAKKFWTLLVVISPFNGLLSHLDLPKPHVCCNKCIRKQFKESLTTADPNTSTRWSLNNTAVIPFTVDHLGGLGTFRPLPFIQEEMPSFRTHSAAAAAPTTV